MAVKTFDSRKKQQSKPLIAGRNGSQNMSANLAGDQRF